MSLSFATPGNVDASGAAPAGSENVLGLEDLDIRMWNFSADLRGGIGYKDNVLLSHTDSQDSAFWMSGAEFMVFRLPSHGWLLNFFVDANDIRYFDAPSVGDEQFILAVAQVSKTLASEWKSTLGLNYMYQNQVFDLSATYTTNVSIGQILGHTAMPRLGLQKSLGSFSIEAEISGTRQWLEEPLDDYWQYGPRVVVGHAWKRGSELTISYQYSPLDYDSRPQADGAGEAITNSSLALTINSADLAFTHVWDEEAHWRTITSLGYGTTTDNGSGFYDYRDYRLSQHLRFQDGKWEVNGRARLGYSDYETQTVSLDDSARRYRTSVGLSLRVERKLTRNLKAHATYTWDRSISNLEFDDYEVNVVMAGLALVF
jgi:hypothetical protein